MQLFVTVSAKTVPNGTFGISRNTIWNIEATAVLLCYILVMLDLHYNYSSYLASVL